MKITNKLTHGMYVVTTNGGGCIVDTVSQVSGTDNPLISISVMKSNYTNELVKKNKKLVLSVLSKDVDPNLIDNFGFHSARDYDKFSSLETFDVESIPVPKSIIGYIYLSVEDTIENDTHTLFICKYIKGEVLNDSEEMTYNYYREHKDDLVKSSTSSGKTAWVCTICGYVYYGEELPDDFKCPVCGVGKEYFKKQE